jgi:hypothetical protein
LGVTRLRILAEEGILDTSKRMLAALKKFVDEDEGNVFIDDDRSGRPSSVTF